MSKKLWRIFSLTIVVVMMSTILVACGTGSAAKGKAGTYSSTQKGFGGDVTLTITLSEEGKIEKAEVDAAKETDTIGLPAAEKLAGAMAEKQTIALDTVSGATVTSKAVLAAAEDCISQSGFDVESFKKASTAKGEDEELTYDIVVAGGGGSGVAAALAASETGAKVLVVEKTGSIGGNTLLASGMFAVESSLQKEAGVETSADEAVRQLLEYNHYLSNGPLTRAIVEKSASTIDWLRDYGVELYLQNGYSTQYSHLGENENYEAFSYHKYVDSGAKQFETILAALEANGVDIMYNTVMEDLLVDESGNVTGIVATKEDGGKLTVNAQQTIVATGGFGADLEKVADVLDTDYLNSIGMPNMGEGLTAMVNSAGAIEIDGTPALHGCQLAESTITTNSSDEVLAGFSETPITQLLMSPLLWVDTNGTRFANEDLVYDTAFWANAAVSVGGRYFFIVDKDTLEAYTNGAGGTDGTDGDILVSSAGPGASYVKGDFVELANAAVEAGTAWKGSTIEELAKAAGMDPERLQETVSRYNEIVKSGNDTDFFKSSESLVYDVDGEEYYAFDVRAVFLGTIGGVKVNDELEVVDKDNKAIEGLYAVGTNAGGYYEGDGYPPYEGLACSFAWNSGRIAGESAAAKIKN